MKGLEGEITIIKDLGAVNLGVFTRQHCWKGQHIVPHGILWGMARRMKHIKTTNAIGFDSLLATVVQTSLRCAVVIIRRMISTHIYYWRGIPTCNSTQWQTCVGEGAWSKLMEGYSGAVTTTYLLSSLMMWAFVEMLRSVHCSMIELVCKVHIRKPLLIACWIHYIPDDDTSLYKMSGFALHSSLQVHKRKLTWRR